MNIKPEEIYIKDYTYELPQGRIAQHPLAERDSSKLLIYTNDRISHDIFRNISTHITENSLLIFNNTKVVNARLLFETEDKKQVEIFCLEPVEESDMQAAFQTAAGAVWKCIVGNLKAWKDKNLHKKFVDDTGIFILNAEMLERTSHAFYIKLWWTPQYLTFAEILVKFGAVPLPPYMKRTPEVNDSSRYQTIYAKPEGSVAAPTAGLHFTETVFGSLKQKNISIENVTLHVGAGTFKPVKSETISQHSMHGERFYIEKPVIENIVNHLNSGRKIISVGTTSMRTIESLYWYGVQLMNHKTVAGGEVFISQWEPYENDNSITAVDALNAVLTEMENTNISYISGTTEIIIVPGYEFKIFSGLITNFHQPSSTLLLLIAAFIGTGWKQAYEYALNNDFRFLSYGDSSLLFR